MLDSKRFALRSLRYYWRYHVAVTLGIAAAAAVLTGALLIGDSVRGSLRRLTLDRLGYVDQILLGGQFFSTDIVQLPSDDGQSADSLIVQPAILLNQVSAEPQTAKDALPVGNVTLVASDAEFWRFSTHGAPAAWPEGRAIVINSTLADRLDVQTGDRILLRLPNIGGIAADSTLAHKTDLTSTLAELRVAAIIPSEGIGRFTLQVSQSDAPTAFLPLKLVQSALDKQNLVNAVFVGDRQAGEPLSAEQTERVRDALKPTLRDVGLRLDHVQAKYWNESTGEEHVAWGYWNISSDAMVILPQVERQLQQALDSLPLQETMTYLANWIINVSRETDQATPDNSTGDSKVARVPYSTVTAVDNHPVLGPMTSDDGTPLPPLADEEIALNRWTAEQLQATEGDQIRLTYFHPETTHEQPSEASKTFTLRQIVPLVKPLVSYSREQSARYVSPPARSNDPHLTPTVEGITDQESIDDWDPPFPFDYDRIREPEDEEYWDNYRTTPKAFVSKSVGEQIWGSRFGDTTTLRIPDNEVAEQTIRQRIVETISRQPQAFGLTWLQVKADGLQAASGTTPFNLLFLGFSFFIIAAAALLVALLFKLNVQHRVGEAGLIMATGVRRITLMKLYLLEGFGLAIIGSVIGGLLGILYANLMLIGLRTLWLDAIVTPFLSFHFSFSSWSLGIVAGIVVAMITIVWTVLDYRKRSVRQLLQEDIGQQAGSNRPGTRMTRPLPYLLLGVALILAIVAVLVTSDLQAGLFFASGAATLSAVVWLLARFLRWQAWKATAVEKFSMTTLVIRNLARNATRSVLTLGLMGSACFLIIAISAFQLEPSESGTGGFELIVQCEAPIFTDLNQPLARRDVFGSQAEAWQTSQTLAFRFQEGDDASCRNLYKARRPRLLGLPAAGLSRLEQYSEADQGFSWADHAELRPAESTPWHILYREEQESPNTESPNTESANSVPVILDKNTAMYSLHLYGGIGEEFQLDYGAAGEINFEVVGLLSNSVLQGMLITSEPALLDRFPRTSGFRFFLIDTGQDSQSAISELLFDGFSDQGIDIVDTHRRLRDLLAIQNTYLSTFQSLGGLGLLLGTFGLTAAQLRNVFERRSELGLLRAAGFTRSRIAWLIFSEHLVLLLAGLAVGAITALIVVLPHSADAQATLPWKTLAAMLSLVLLVGIMTGTITARRVLTMPIVPALRSKS